MNPGETPSTPTPTPTPTPATVGTDAAHGTSPRKPPTMAFSGWYPYIAGAAIGLLLRLVFMGEPGGAMSAMLGAFIYLAPALCGAVTVYTAELRMRRSWLYYLFAPWASTALMVCGALTIMVEGWICAVVIFPMFMLIGSLGGAIMGLVCRITHWPRQTVMAFAALPLMLGMIEPQFENPIVLSKDTQSVFVAASPARVWQALTDVRDIQAEEVDNVWAYRIGVPRPLESITQEVAVSADTPTGHIRRMQWARGVRFDGLITTWKPGQELAWNYRFGPGAVPPGALDDHVQVGGHYFDLKNTRFTLRPRDGGTELNIEVNWRTSTRFNWYADGVAKLLIGNFNEGILDFYRQRAERLGAQGPPQVQG